MKDGHKYLLMRYATDYVKDCIEKHLMVITDKGYCWFGKVGTIPSKKILEKVFEEKKPTLILYRKGAAYECLLDKYSFTRPSDGVPEYYEEEGIYPSIFFRLLDMKKCKEELFHDSVVISTGAYVEDVVYHSRISFMLCKYIDPKLQKELDSKDCRYKKDEICTCKACVNYGCFCERPNNCIKQRR